MLIEVKVKVARVIDGKTRKRIETFLIEREVFAEAEYAVTSGLMQEQDLGTVEDFEIQSLKISPIKEVCTEYTGGSSYMTTLRDVFITDDGTEKELKYKVLLWADSLSEAMARTNVFARQGYNMNVDGLKEVNYEYLGEQSNQEDETERESQ